MSKWLKMLCYDTPYWLQHAAAWHRPDLNMKDWVKSTKNEISIISWKNHPPLRFEPCVYCFTICAISPLQDKWLFKYKKWPMTIMNFITFCIKWKQWGRHFKIKNYDDNNRYWRHPLPQHWVAVLCSRFGNDEVVIIVVISQSLLFQSWY